MSRAEPKFKVGEWVKLKGILVLPRKVLEIRDSDITNEHCYLFSTSDGSVLWPESDLESCGLLQDWEER